MALLSRGICSVRCLLFCEGNKENFLIQLSPENSLVSQLLPS